VDGGELRLLSPDDTFVYEYDWTPDGRALVGTAAKGDGDNNWWIATLNAFDATTGAVREIAHPDYQMSMPRVAPDGRSVVFVGGLMSDFGAVGGELYSVPIEGGVPTSLTPGFKGSFTAPLWRGAELYATALIVDRVTLVRLEGPTHTPRALWSIAASAQATDADVALSRDGRVLATVVEDFERAPSILAGPVGKATTLTHDNDALTVRLDVKSVLWKNEGFEVQGWLVGPAERPAGARYPLIVHVHGGPSAAALPIYGADDSFYATVHEWAARGYYLFLPNPRGSYGQGEAFTRANIRDFGGGDFRDIMTGIDAAAANAPIDTERLGIHGHSYGGFMVMWAVTHTHRFKAAVGGAGLSNWISYYGENGIDTWMTPFFGATMYDEPGIYRAASPIESIKQAKTPTLLYTGELDVEVPAPQSFEFWHGLKAMGVPTELHVYPGEGHLIQKPESISDLRKRVPGWFDKYLKP
jgi:dipeptidyl aminopeptidase/acylaminoacyl peptidase